MLAPYFMPEASPPGPSRIGAPAVESVGNGFS